MPATTETSVLMALDEIRKLEDDRQRAIDAAKAAEELAERAAAEAVRAEEAHRRRVAEAEARVRVEAEERARREDSERRVAALRAELDAVRRDREALHLAIAARAEAIPAASPPARGRGIVLVAAFASSLALALGFALAPREPHAISVVEAPVRPAATSAPIASAEATAVAETPEPATTVEPAAVAPEPRHRGRRGQRNVRQPPSTSAMTDADRLLRDLDACERRGGLLCGTE